MEGQPAKETAAPMCACSDPSCTKENGGQAHALKESTKWIWKRTVKAGQKADKRTKSRVQ